MYLALVLASLVELVLTFAVAALSARAAIGIMSRTLRLFAAAFSLLATSSAVKLAFFAESGYPVLLPIAASVEATGFLLLALSHVYSVRRPSGELLPLVLLLPYPFFAAYSMARGVSLYLVLYAAVETTLFYIETRNKVSIITALGLYVIFSSIAVSFTAFGAANDLVVELIGVVGYFLLTAPGIASYVGARGGGR